MKSIRSLLAYVVLVNFTIALPAVAKIEASLYPLNVTETEAIREKYDMHSHALIEIGYENIKRIRLLLMAINSSIDLPEANSRYYEEIGLTISSPEIRKGLMKGHEINYALRYFFRKDLEEHLGKIDLLIKNYDYKRLIKIVENIGDGPDISVDLFCKVLDICDVLADYNSSHLSLVDDIYDKLGKGYGYDHYIHIDKDYGGNPYRKGLLENVIMNYVGYFRYALMMFRNENFYRKMEK